MIEVILILISLKFAWVGASLGYIYLEEENETSIVKMIFIPSLIAIIFSFIWPIIAIFHPIEALGLIFLYFTKEQIFQTLKKQGMIK